MIAPNPPDLLPHIAAALESVKSLPIEQQQTALEGAAAIARHVSELRQRLYVAGTIIATLQPKA